MKSVILVSIYSVYPILYAILHSSVRNAAIDLHLLRTSNAVFDIPIHENIFVLPYY